MDLNNSKYSLIFQWDKINLLRREHMLSTKADKGSFTTKEIKIT